MPWFAVRYAAERVLDDAEGLYEDSILLIKAEGEAAAREKGEAAARRSNHEYANSVGEDVQWEFREILDVKQLFDDEIQDGSEIYYAFLTRTQLKSVRAALAAPSG
jgi:hypothetical protein